MQSGDNEAMGCPGRSAGQDRSLISGDSEEEGPGNHLYPGLN